MTKKSETKQVPDPTGEGDYAKETIAERRRRRTEATTVDGSESFPPPGMDLPDGGMVPLDAGADTAKSDK
jgi:hypothetical protein